MIDTAVKRGRALGVAVLLPLVVLATTGCLQSDVDVTVRSDRSGQIDIEVFLNSDVREALGGTDVEAMIEGAFQQVEGYEFVEFELGGREGYRLHIPFDDYRDVTDVITGGGVVAGQQIVLFSDFRITELPAGGWELDATVNPIGQMIAATRNDRIPENIQQVFDLSGIGAAGTGLDLTIALPGEVTSSNATKVEGGSATWRLDEPDAPSQLRMHNEPKPLLSPVMMVIGAALVVVLIGVMLALFGSSHTYHRTEGDRKRRKSAKRRAKQKASDTPNTGWAPSVGAAAQHESRLAAELPALEPLAPLVQAADQSAPPTDQSSAPPPSGSPS